MVNATSNKPTYPRAPFPEELKTHPLLVVDFAKILQRDEAEIDILYKACTNLGFFYLKNHGLDNDTLVEPMFEMGEATFALPEDYLQGFEQGDGGMSAGFKKAGSTNVDAEGNVDTAYFINVNKGDALHYPKVIQRTYPSTVIDAMSTVTDFITKSDAILIDLMRVLEIRLGLPEGTLEDLHPKDKDSGSESRVISKPASGERGHLPEGKTKDGQASATIGAHTDFGSFSMLHGRGTGGLQVLPPGTTEWQYIKPLPGHVVCNVGDTLAVYSGNIFKSNIHRVVPPPAPQNAFTRYSLVYFIRPYYDAILAPLSNLSPKVAEHAATDPAMQSLPKMVTAGEWFKRRVMNQRAANRKGPETWAASRGTEHTPAAA